METKEVDILVNQIKNIILNKPLQEEYMDHESEEFQYLQKFIFYLSDCIRELNECLGSLCIGSLDIDPPGRHNFLAGSLKELHSVLKHLTWQATQVANGDYGQRVRFLGEFSDSFNRMIEQLEEREIKLKEKTNALSRTTNSLASIIDAQKDRVIVTDTASGEVLFSNQYSKEHFYNLETKQTFCKAPCGLLDQIKSEECPDGEHQFEYYCERANRYFQVKSYALDWEGSDAVVHFMADITHEKESKENWFKMAYIDDLTGAYNRRYCIEKIQELIDTHGRFSLVLLDLDDLKHVNDCWGHIAGDEYLCTCVQVINENIRDSDIVCRIGGDEFVILLKKCGEVLALKKMDQINRQIIATKKPYPLSISYGVHYISSERYLSSEEIIKLSDSKMYTFKNNRKKAAAQIHITP